MYRIGQEEKDAVARVIDTRDLFKINNGMHETEQCEALMRDIFGVKRSLLMTSGLSALTSALIGMGIGVIGATAILPYQKQEKRWRDFGQTISDRMPPEATCVYKYEVQGLYNGLFYSGKPVYKLREDDTLPERSAIYVISPRYPQLPGRSWRQIHTWDRMSISLWEGLPAADMQEEMR